MFCINRYSKPELIDFRASVDNNYIIQTQVRGDVNIYFLFYCEMYIYKANILFEIEIKPGHEVYLQISYSALGFTSIDIILAECLDNGIVFKHRPITSSNMCYNTCIRKNIYR